MRRSHGSLIFASIADGVRLAEMIFDAIIF